MHYLVTGHTGFKGSWLTLMLRKKGHTVSGISLDPSEKSLFVEADISELVENDMRFDIRNLELLKKSVTRIDPDVIVHLAAQSLVRESYKYPIETFETNVLGTLNILEASRELNNLKAVLIVTSDKVYKMNNEKRPFLEDDPLGGGDPYSASKAAADIATQSWIASFQKTPIGIARAGNVIGGGDWAVDRVIPDLVGAFSAGIQPMLRFPGAIRPWQHVLDCLSGYLKLVDYMIDTSKSEILNFGPSHLKRYTVGDLTNEMGKNFGILDTGWELDRDKKPNESDFLLLDSSKSFNTLNWRDHLEFSAAVKWTADWYRNQSTSARIRTESQISNFLDFDNI